MPSSALSDCPRTAAGKAYLPVSALLLSLTLCAVALRLYSRLKIVKAFWWDDATIVLSASLSTTAIALYIQCLRLGMGRPESCAPHAIAVAYGFYENVAHTAVIYGKLLARLSAAVFVLRLFGISRGFKAFIVVWSAFLTAVIAPGGVLIWFRCEPVEAIWDGEVAGRCWSPQAQFAFGYLTAVVSSAADLIVAIAPAVHMRQLGLPVRSRIFVGSLFAFTLIPFIFAVSLISTAYTQKDVDPMRDTAVLHLLTTIEMSMLIVCACLPTLPPFFTGLARRKNVRSPSPTSPTDEDLAYSTKEIGQASEV